MKKLFLVFLLLISCSNSSKLNNPVAPNLNKPISGPPILYLDFENTTNNLHNSIEIWCWINQYAIYNGYSIGWGDASSTSTIDNAKNLAYNLWLSNKDKSVGGVCGNFAGFYVYCLRKHGYQTGGVVYYWHNQDGSTVGHIEAWVVEKSGKVSTSSNTTLEYERFNNLKELKAYYDLNHTGTDRCVYYYNNKLIIMSNKEIAETF